MSRVYDVYSMRIYLHYIRVHGKYVCRMYEYTLCMYMSTVCISVPIICYVMLCCIVLLGNPSLFSFHSVLHDSWPASQGPAKDTYYIGIINHTRAYIRIFCRIVITNRAYIHL